MSNIHVDTIRKTGGSLGTDIRVKNTSVVEAGSGTSVTHNLSASLPKSWISVTFSGGTPTNEDGLNIASITDTAAGQCTVAFTTSFDDAADYCITTGTLNTDGAQEVYEVYVKATGSFRTYVFNSGGGAGVDPEAFYSVCMGDLA